MKRIQLLRLTLLNFKGARNFTLNAEGKEVRIYGTNEAGKTTLADGFTWLLFGKDTQNKTDFGIKTLDEFGKELHNLEHEVEGSFLVGGMRRTLRRVYREVYTRKRGAATLEFSGHTTDYFVDGVPVKKSEYEDEVAALVDEEYFKLLTNPTYFSEQLDWRKRRKTLLDVCGDITDDDVMAGNKSLAALPTILQGRTIDKHKAVIAARRKEINEELQKLPIRIDEASRSMPETDGLDKQWIETRIAELTSQQDEKRAEISRIQSGGEVAVKERRLREIEGELQQLKNELQGDTLERVAAKRREESRLRQEADDIRFEIETLERRIKSREQAISERRGEADRLRSQWKARNDEQFHGHTHDENCPYCGQALPAEQVAAAHSKALAEFNRAKAEALESISRRGRAATLESTRLEAENIEASDLVQKLSVTCREKYSDAEFAAKELATLQSNVADVESHPAYIQKREELASVRQEIVSLQESAYDAVAVVRSELDELNAAIAGYRQDLAKFELAESTRKRIAEYEQREKELAEEFERLEHELYLTEEFTRAKVAMLESRINSRFQLVRFKLFKEQVNGGLEECCEATYKGVPYGAGLNNAARINAGLDIINTLSEHFEVSVPIFVDNAESVVELIDTVGQKVCLVVSALDKQLRVETIGEEMKEAV
ncbi:AAA family ATPase [Cohnella lubricantis]|uniref:AAA family ATPase n=1 Tax=Cohnella lubricantis TaxID=2163172 RepID=A0A841TAP8_9BACL|nr:AAA family ATPase [Cohnella lubricantis]MBB6676468.1 AAA family ATPase [Cohnella lubricantis]MBP2117084.1 DNA repair exonuclease SbcCD ATPase subunit [Cohnella lubricantis]